MKNIHILPTDKPSRLVKIYSNVNRETFTLKLDVEVNDSFKEYVNIYITSDEEIKEGDYFIAYSVTIDKKPYISCASEYKERKKEKGKIILTTDQNLIKDGVQAIDDEFLEWFINNQSCESVEVRKECCGQCDERLCEVYDRGIGWSKNNTFYEIIIPKEEPKQETLEETVKKEIPNRIRSTAFGSKFEWEPTKERKAFIRGAKWQAERMYSEEDLIELLNFVTKEYNISNGIGWFHTHNSIEDISSKEVLEQFKKKEA